MVATSQVAGAEFLVQAVLRSAGSAEAAVGVGRCFQGYCGVGGAAGVLLRWLCHGVASVDGGGVVVGGGAGITVLVLLLAVRCGLREEAVLGALAAYDCLGVAVFAFEACAAVAALEVVAFAGYAFGGVEWGVCGRGGDGSGGRSCSGELAGGIAKVQGCGRCNEVRDGLAGVLGGTGEPGTDGNVLAVLVIGACEEQFLLAVAHANDGGGIVDAALVAFLARGVEGEGGREQDRESGDEIEDLHDERMVRIASQFCRGCRENEEGNL